MPKRFIKIFAPLCLIFLLSTAAFAQTADAKLLELRRQFAVNYLNPEAHFALARYFIEKDDKLQAFYIMEYARRYRFPEEKFDAAFVKFFGDNSPEPDDKAKQAFKKAYEFLEQNKLAEAERSFVAAANLAPKSAFIQAWVGRFFLKAKKDDAQALKYYYNAYFLDPHAYDTEFAESRITNIEIDAAALRFAELVKSGKPLPALSADANPLIAGRALEQMAKQWKKEYLKPVWKSLENDDSGVRWLALETLMKNAGAESDALIAELANSADLRTRAFTAYALVEFQKEKSFERLKKMLSDKAELIRFDAVSALVLKGGPPGLEVVRAHRKSEPNPFLQELIDQALSNQ